MHTYMSMYSFEYVSIPLNTKMTQTFSCGILSPTNHLYSYHIPLITNSIALGQC